MGFLDNLGQSFGNMTNDPKQMGLLMAAAQMMAQSGPSNRPVGLGEIMGGGMQTYLGTKNAMQQQQAEAEEREQMQQYRGVQMQSEQQKMEAAKAALVKAQGLEDHFKKFRKGGQPHPMAASAQDQGLAVGFADGAEAPQMGVMPPMQGQPQQPQESPYQRHMAMAEHMRAGGYETEANAYEDRALKFAPKVKNWQEVRVGNSVLMAPFFEDGTEGRPMTLEVARKLEFRDGGGTNDAYDPYTGQRKVSVGKTQSPDSSASAATAKNRLAFDERQAAAPVFNAELGGFVSRPGTQAQGGFTPIAGLDRGSRAAAEAQAKRSASSASLLPVLDQAEGLIDGATGSYAGAGIDQAARFFGKSTDGAKATAQLKVLEGQIMMSQPRMEGPQSNMDVQMYRQMAGQIGDPTTPNSTKKAALEAIRTLHQKYAGQGGASGDWAPQAGAPSIDSLLDKYGR